MIAVSFTWHPPRNRKSPTIAEALATRLGRQPSHAELCEEVRRILRAEKAAA